MGQEFTVQLGYIVQGQPRLYGTLSWERGWEEREGGREEEKEEGRDKAEEKARIMTSEVFPILLLLSLKGSGS